MVLGAVGMAFQAIGSIERGNAEAKAANYQAQVASNNAVIARQNANYAAQAGEVSAQQEGLKNRARLGGIISSFGANNVDVNSGSALATQESQREVGMQDVLQIRSNARRTAYGYQTEATNFDAQSQLDRAEAEQAREAGWIGGMTSLLGGGAGLGADWQKYQLSNPGSNSLDTSYLLSDPVNMTAPAGAFQP